MAEPLILAFDASLATQVDRRDDVGLVAKMATQPALAGCVGDDDLLVFVDAADVAYRAYATGCREERRTLLARAHRQRSEIRRLRDRAVAYAHAQGRRG